LNRIYICMKGLAMEYDTFDFEDVMNLLYEHRKFAIDPECTWNIRNEAWAEIDLLLDRFNKLVMREVEV